SARFIAAALLSGHGLQPDRHRFPAAPDAPPDHAAPPATPVNVWRVAHWPQNGSESDSLPDQARRHIPAVWPASTPAGPAAGNRPVTVAIAQPEWHPVARGHCADHAGYELAGCAADAATRARLLPEPDRPPAALAKPAPRARRPDHAAPPDAQPAPGHQSAQLHSPLRTSSPD